MAKYKVGDSVIVRKDLDEEITMYWMDDKADWWYATDNMVDAAGQTVTIKELFTSGDRCLYYICEGFNDHDDFWTDEMFVGLEDGKEETPMPTEFKVGDRVKFVKGIRYGNLEYGYVGTVIVICDYDDYDYGVEFDNPCGGHDCGDEGKVGYCFWVTKDQIELIQSEPTPEPIPTPTPINVNITVNLYENSCWYCRKGGLVDLYLAGAMGICPNCKRVCNATNALPKSHKPSDPWKKENKPLTTEELKALPDGTRVFVLFKEYENGEWTVDDWNNERTCWRTKQGNRLNRKQGHVFLDENQIAYTAYLEEPKRPREPEAPEEIEWDI